MYKSCKYLEEALYVAPNEIRACCQRFFYNGKMRGDAKLLSIVENKLQNLLILQKLEKKILMKYSWEKITIAKVVFF